MKNKSSVGTTLSLFRFSPRNFLIAILAAGVLSGCGKDDPKPEVPPAGGDNPPAESTPASSSGTAVVQGFLSLPASSAESPSDYAVFNSFQSVTPTANGSLSIAVSQSGLTVTYAVSKSGKKVYSATTTGAVEPFNINAQSTAETLVLLNPLLIPDSVEEQARVISQVRSNGAVSALASVIEFVYVAVEEPLSDPRILEAARDAVLSVLGSLSATTTSSTAAVPAISSNLPRALSRGAPTALSETPDVCAGGVAALGSMYVCGGDMGALDLKTSSGTTLRLVPGVVGRWGTKVKTNVDWVAEIIELDSSKLQWTKYGPVLPLLQTPDELASLVKAGGYRQKVIVNGQIAAGFLGFVVDPVGVAFGELGEMIDSAVFPVDGFTLPGDGVYAVVALSGSRGLPKDVTEYDSVKNNPWQKALWQEAQTINIIAAALDVVDVSVTIGSANPLGAEQFKSVIRATYPLILNRVQIADDHGAAFFAEAVSVAIGAIVDSLVKLSTPRNLFETVGIKASAHAGLIVANKVLSALNVWSGSISLGSRMLNFGLNVTPREVGYVVVGSPSVVADQTAPSAPTGFTAALVSLTRVSLAWIASTDNVSVAGYRLYRNGALQGTEATTSRYDTVPSGNSQYCYEVTAYDATGNESARSSARCVTQAQAALPATPGSFAASSQPQGIVALGWLDNSDNETGYKIERKVGTGGSFVQIAAIGSLAGIGSGGSYQDSDLAAGTTYCYRMRAYNLVGDSSFTGESCATAQTGTLPIPGSFILSNDPPVCDLNPPAASPAVRLNWTAASGATSYDVYRNDVSYAPKVTGTAYYNSANLIAGQSYTYKVVARNVSGSTETIPITVSIPANICTTTPTPTIPGAPQNLAASGGNGQNSLSWNAPSSNGGATITSYRVFRGTTSSNRLIVTSGGCANLSAALTCTDTGLTNGQSYDYVVRAVNSVDQGAPSNSATTTPAATATIPGAPQNLAASAGNGQNILSWNAPSSNGGSTITSYRVFRGTSSTNRLIVTSGGCASLGAVLSCTDTGLTNGQPYDYVVRAVNSVGEGTPSNSTTTTPAAAQSDLVVVGSLGVSPDPITTGNTLTVSISIKNQGTGNAPATTTRLQIKNAALTVTVADQTHLTPAISAGQTITQTSTVNIPVGTTPGSYNAYVVLDTTTVGNQSNTSNDYGSSNVFTINAPAAAQSDLVIVGSLSVSPNPITAGNTLTVGISIKNQGAGNAPATTTRLQIKNAALTATVADQTHLTPAISAGQTITQTSTVNIPVGTTPGSYNAYGALDTTTVGNQSNVSNDYGSSNVFTINAPAAAQSDLVVVGSLSVSPNPITAGNTLTVGISITNQGAGNAPATTTRLQIKNAALTTTVADQTHPTPAISAGQTITQTYTVNIPVGTTPGSYNAYGALDTTTVGNQSNASNDYGSSNVFTINVPVAAATPDLQVLNGSLVGSGASLIASWTLANQGTGTANASTTVVRINQSSTSSTGSNLASISTPSLVASGSQPQSATLTPPTAAGTYYVWVLADNSSTSGQSSSAAANDIIRIGSFTVAVPVTAPDLQVLNGSVLGSGASLIASWTLANQGTGTANASTTVVRINQSSTSSTGSNLASISTPSLVASGSQLQSATLTPPTAAGTYYVWVLADNFSTSGQSSSAAANDIVRIGSFTMQ